MKRKWKESHRKNKGFPFLNFAVYKVENLRPSIDVSILGLDEKWKDLIPVPPKFSLPQVLEMKDPKKSAKKSPAIFATNFKK